MQRLRLYELVYITRPDAGDDVLGKLRDRLTEVVEKHQGRLLRHDTWGKRKLAYEIKKNPKGVYQYVQFVGDEGAVNEIQRHLRISDPVLKFLTVLLDPDVKLEDFDADGRRQSDIAAANEIRIRSDEEEAAAEAVERPRPRRNDDDDDDDDQDDDAGDGDDDQVDDDKD